jgi:hypothetical protein
MSSDMAIVFFGRVAPSPEKCGAGIDHERRAV